MKKLILLTCLLTGIFISCNKDTKKQDDTEKKFMLRIRLSDLKLSSDDLPGGRKRNGPARIISGDSLKLYFHYLEYRLFDLTDEFAYWATRSQRYTDEDFGDYQVMLPAHDFVIAVVGYNDSVWVRGDNMPLPGSDFFYARSLASIRFEYLNADLHLRRIVGKLRVIINDQIPGNVRKITVTPMVFPYPGFDQGIPNHIQSKTGEIDPGGMDDPDFPLPWMHLGHYLSGDTLVTGLTLDSYFFADPSRKMTLKIEATDANGETVSIKRILTEIPVVQNKITTVSGNLFDSTNNQQGISIRLEDPIWSADSVMAF